MRTTVTFLVASLAVVLLYRYATAGTISSPDVPHGFMANITLLGTLGLARRARRMRNKQAI